MQIHMGYKPAIIKICANSSNQQEDAFKTFTIMDVAKNSDFRTRGKTIPEEGRNTQYP